MIIERKKYELFGEKVFEKLTVVPPFKLNNSMPNEACFYYVLSGQYKAVSPITAKIIFKNEALLMKCGNYLNEMFGKERDKVHEAIAIHFHPNVLKKIYEFGLPDFLKENKNENPPIDIASIKNEQLLVKYIEGMVFYFENPEIVNEEILILKLKELILLLNHTQNAQEIRQLLSSLFSPRKYSFKKIVESNTYSAMALEQMAYLTNLSLSSFKREFKAVFNDSPAHYLKCKKLERAKQLLLESDTRIADVALECGFNNAAVFSLSFKEKYSISPKEFQLSQNHK